MAIDTQAGTLQTASLLQHARPQILLWATPDTAGGAGPIDPAVLPDGCHSMLVPNPYMTAHDTASDKYPTSESSHQSDSDKQVQRRLPELVAEWQKLTAGRPKLPFCYVMYTSGSTGSAAGVCGTETGQYPVACCLTSYWKVDLAYLCVLHHHWHG